MKNRVVIVENLPCTNPECQHRTAVKTRSASSQPGNISKGFVLWKPECVSNWSSFPPKTHDTEVIDMCSASMSSHYRYRRNPCTPLRLKRLVLCYYHSVNAYAEAAIKHFGIGANPCLLDRAQRSLRNNPHPRLWTPLSSPHPPPPTHRLPPCHPPHGHPPALRTTCLPIYFAASWKRSPFWQVCPMAF
jgi:hypothetical protein